MLIMIDFSLRLKLGKPFDEGKSGGQWGTASDETSNAFAMGAMNGNPSMRSSTGPGERHSFLLPTN